MTAPRVPLGLYILATAQHYLLEAPTRTPCVGCGGPSLAFVGNADPVRGPARRHGIVGEGLSEAFAEGGRAACAGCLLTHGESAIAGEG